MRTKLHTLLVGAACALFPASAALAEFNVLGTAFLPNGAEILSYDKSSQSLLSTYSGAGGHGVRIYGLSGAGQLGVTRDVDLSNAFGNGAGGVYGLSSVAADPLGRDFGVASLIPSDNGNATGKVVFFQLSTGAVLNTLDVGYHPDSVAISPDGSRVVVANEGEFVSLQATQRAGSISVVNLAGVSSAASLAALNNNAVSTATFEAANLGAGVSIDGLRNNRDQLTGSAFIPVPSGQRHLDIEPEYVVAGNDKAYISLQEQNAVAVYDYASGKITAIHDLGTSVVRMDANRNDKIANVSDQINALRSPDTIAKLERDGQTYIVTANEGDFRPDDGDRVSYSSAVSNGLIAPETKAALDAAYGGNSVAAIGDLRISRIDGDTNGDGKIDVITAISTRGISIINADSGAFVFDSGSMIEDFVAANDPATFNINGEDIANRQDLLDNPSAFIDARSRDKGPEIEAVAVGTVNGRDYVFAAAERQNGIFAFDVTDFENVAIVDYFNFFTAETAFGDFRAPESLLFIAAEDSPTGEAMLIVGFEVSGSIAVFDLSKLASSAIPEPSSAAALAGAAALGLVASRRRRAAG